MAQARKIIDIPLAEVAPQEVRVRLLSEEFAHLKRQRHESKVSWQSAQADRSVGGPALLRAFDAHMVANSRLEAYKDATAALLPPVAVPESGFALPDGVTLLGEAESGTPAWRSMRQGTLGGSDVGAICKVGQYGKSNYDDVRDSKMGRSRDGQANSGAALRGDIWEPWLVEIVGSLLEVQTWANKGTYTDGLRHVNVDGFTTSPDGRVAQVIEAKTSAHPEEWETSIPEGHALQTQHYGDFLRAEGSALLVANLDDERLVIWEVPLDHKVPAGKDSPQKLGTEFSYADVRQYAEGMVGKWAKEARTPLPKPRREFLDTPAIRASWEAALSKGVVLGDLETTGYSPSQGHVIELALVRVQAGREIERFHRFYGVPADHAEWNGTGPEEVHHISLADIEGCPVLIESPDEAQAIREFIGDSVLVAHHAPFEDKWLSFSGVSVPIADTLLAFGIAVRDHGIRGNSMRELMAWAGFEYKNPHRAINDVLMMLQAWPALHERIKAWLKTKAPAA